MGSNKFPGYFAASDWLEALLQEYDNEVKSEANWPVLLLQSSSRKLIWYLSNALRVDSKGIPGNACRLMERYLSRHMQTFFEVFRDEDEWERYRTSLTARYYLLAVSCIQLAAKMTDLTVPLTASVVRSVLLKENVVHSKGEIVAMEFHVYSTLDFRIPLWTSLEVAEFFAIHVGFGSPSMLKAVALIINLTEFNRDLLELHLRCWSEVFNTPGSSSSSTSRFTSTVGTLHIAAAGVCTAARFLRASLDPTHTIAALTRTSPSYLKAISETIYNHIIPRHQLQKD